METKKKILIIIPSMVGGGAEKALLNLLNHLDNSKFDIDLLVAERKGIYLDQVPANINMFHLFKNNFLKRVVVELHRRLNINWPFKILTRNKVSSKYDVGICFLDSVFTDILLFLEDRITRSAIVLHSSYKTNRNKSKFIKGSYKERLKNRYRKIDTIVGVSQDVIDEFTTLFGEFDDMRVINNPIPRDEIIDKSKEFIPKFTDTSFNLIAVGSLLPVKGYETLLHACKMLKDSGMDFQLRILGKGPLQEQLKDQIQRLGLENYVYLLGFISNPYPYMLHSDIFVMSSLAEGLPTVLCEAMILGKPVVVTNCSGCRGLVEEGTYGYVTETTAESLFEGLRSMMNDPELRRHYSQKAKQRAKLFNVDHAIREYGKIFDDATPDKILNGHINYLENV